MPKLIRIPLPDGMAALERWARAIPAANREASLAMCHLRFSSPPDARDVTFEVPSAASAHLIERGGLTVEDIDERPTERIPVGQLAGRLLLQSADSTTAPDSLLVLMEGLDAEGISETIAGLSEVATSDQIIHRLQGEDSTEVLAVELLGVVDPSFVRQAIGAATLHQVRNSEGVRFATPFGNVHPLVDTCPSMLRTSERRGGVNLWRSVRGGTRTGEFTHFAIRSSEKRIPADLFELTGAFADVEPPTPSGEPPRIPIRMIRDAASRRVSEIEVGSMLMEVTGTTSNQALRSLLDLLDEVEAGLLDRDTTIWTSRHGASELSPTTYHVWFRSERRPEDFAATGARVFVQPLSFLEREIPLFIELGWALRPALDRVHDVVGRDHPVFVQLAERFPSEIDGRRCRHLLRSNPHGAPSHLTLAGGDPLIDLVGEVVLEAHALPIGEVASRDRRLGERIADRIREERESTIDRIADAGRIESEAIRGEFDATLSELQRLTERLEGELGEVAARVEQLKSTTAAVGGCIQEAPRSWWQLSDSVNRIDLAILEPREQWLGEMLRQVEATRRNVVEVRSRIGDAVRLVDSRITELEACESAATAAREQLNERISIAEKTGANVNRIATEADSFHDQAFKVLEEVRRRADQETARLEQTAAMISAQRNELATRERELAAVRRQQDEDERRNSERARSLDTEHDRLLKQKADLEREIARLNHLESSEIPQIGRAIERFTRELGRIDVQALERRARSLAANRDDIRRQIEALENRITALDEQERTIAADRQALEGRATTASERLKRITAIEADLRDRETKLTQLRQQLDDREARLDDKRRTVDARRSELSARAAGIARDERKVDREAQRQERVGLFARLFGKRP